jgi:hypothetical protein
MHEWLNYDGVVCPYCAAAKLPTSQPLTSCVPSTSEHDNSRASEAMLLDTLKFGPIVNGEQKLPTSQPQDAPTCVHCEMTFAEHFGGICATPKGEWFAAKGPSLPAQDTVEPRRCNAHPFHELLEEKLKDPEIAKHYEAQDERAEEDPLPPNITTQDDWVDGGIAAMSTLGKDKDDLRILLAEAVADRLGRERQLREALARVAQLEQRIKFEDDITPLPCGCPTFYLYMNEGSLVCGKCGRTYMFPATLHAEKEAAEARVARLKPYVPADVFDWSEKESEK